MFADDRNLFLSSKYINKLFNDMNVELQKISVWFKANNLSLMDTFSLIKEKRLIANDSPILYIDNIEIARERLSS